PADRLISLDEAVHAALKPYEGQSGMAVAGPEVAIASKELTPLSLLLHERATNAGKYGVLGPLEGRLEVRWDREQDGSVVLEWSEQYAQATDVTEEKPGFGSILARMSAIQLDGMVDTEISPQCRTNRLRFVPADKIEA
ncbi:MAG: chemotaxis protein CheB, partial [Rhodobacteraceae bacterium]|nr:chemotaxis protein CheB [Paracoccaceae bacterium]